MSLQAYLDNVKAKTGKTPRVGSRRKGDLSPFQSHPIGGSIPIEQDLQQPSATNKLEFRIEGEIDRRAVHTRPIKLRGAGRRGRKSWTRAQSQPFKSQPSPLRPEGRPFVAKA